MSVHLPPRDPVTDTGPESGSESSESDNDQAFSDWADDGEEQPQCKSLFEEKVLGSAKEAKEWDAKEHGFDLNAISAKLGLDFHGRIRLINWIRATKPKPADASSLTGKEPFFSQDEYLKPTIEDDPLLQLDFEDSWSDDEPEAIESSITEPSDLPSALRRIHALERKLAHATQELTEVRSFVTQRLDSDLFTDSSPPAPRERDDDSHYFESYGESEIHQIMLQDRVRTSTYADFILRTPQIFVDAVVLDVGCGTGILSLFAARAGAKKVFAVDAAPIAEKAREIVKKNGMEDVITVIRGKIEDIRLDLPEGHTGVDVIISEWMGYALLYESMLDSVLVARDKFLRPGGLLAPGQARMKLVLSDGADVFKDRVDFWSDVYGFDLSTMAEGVFTDAAVEIIPESSLLSDPVTVKDIHIPTATTHTLSFSSPFTLVSTSAKRTKCKAFVLYFDTFFPATTDPVPEEEEVQMTRRGEVQVAEVWSLRRRSSQGENLLPSTSPVLTPLPGPDGTIPPLPRKPSLKRPASERKESGVVDAAQVTMSPPTRARSLGPPKMTSFSTGPGSVPTHWKQTVFLLREPIELREGTIVEGTFFCRKDKENKRELDVEIHYEVREPGDSDKGKVKAKERVVQSYKVR